MEGQIAAVVAAGQRQLPVERSFVDADAHGGDLKRAFQHGIPHQNIAVERPVVIVRRAPVVGLAGAELAADLHEEHCVMLAHDGVFALLGREVGVFVLQLLRGDEKYLAVELGMQAREGDAQRIVRLDDGADDVAHRALEIGDVAVTGVDDFFPVPLVDLDRVDVVDLLVTADRVHIGEEPLADIELIALERQTLPLGKALHDLRVVADIGNVEAASSSAFTPLSCVQTN